MKSISKSSSILFLILTFYACANDGIQSVENENVNLKFESPNNLNSISSKVSYSAIIINSEVEFINGLPKLTSIELVEIPAINSETDEITYAYVLKSEYDQWQSSQDNYSKQLKSIQCDFSVESGYGFTGRSFEYGHFYTGTNCETIFAPCDLNCVGFDDVCPRWNEAFT